MMAEAQHAMRQNYINGAPGVLVSGLVWLLAAAATLVGGFNTGMLTLIFGGMLIHPLSVLIAKPFKRPCEPPDKGLTKLSLLSLLPLFAGIFLAYMASLENVALFFPIMALVIGGRYLIFYYVYGLRAFIALGLTLCFAGVILLFAFTQSIFIAPMIVGCIETIFACALFKRSRE